MVQGVVHVPLLPLERALAEDMRAVLVVLVELGEPLRPAIPSFTSARMSLRAYEKYQG